MNQADMAYLGDGVYAGHDGYQVWLTTGDHTNAELVALEPRVILQLLEYADRHLKTNFMRREVADEEAE